MKKNIFPHSVTFFPLEKHFSSKCEENCEEKDLNCLEKVRVIKKMEGKLRKIILNQHKIKKSIQETENMKNVFLLSLQNSKFFWENPCIT